MPRAKLDKAHIAFRLPEELIERLDRVVEDDRKSFYATHSKRDPGVPNRSVWVEDVLRAEVERRESVRADLVTKYLDLVPGGDVSQASITLQKEVDEAVARGETPATGVSLEPEPIEPEPKVGLFRRRTDLD